MGLDSFIEEVHGPWTLFLNKKFRDELVAAGVADPKALVEKGSTPITSRGRAVVAFVPFEGGRMAVREYRHGGMFRFLTGGLFLTKKRPRVELEVLEYAFKAGVSVPEPLGAAVRRTLLGYRAYLYTRVVEDAIDFVEYLSRPSPPLTLEWRAVITSAAIEVRKMHDAGVIHGDLHVKNLLVRPPDESIRYQDSEMVYAKKEIGRPVVGTADGLPLPEVFIIDFDKSRIVDNVPMVDREQNLMRLGRSVDKLPRQLRVTNSDMLRLFRKYLSAGPPLDVDEKLFAERFSSERQLHNKTRKLPGQKEKM